MNFESQPKTIPEMGRWSTCMIPVWPWETLGYGRPVTGPYTKTWSLRRLTIMVDYESPEYNAPETLAPFSRFFLDPNTITCNRIQTDREIQNAISSHKKGILASNLFIFQNLYYYQYWISKKTKRMLWERCLNLLIFSNKAIIGMLNLYFCLQMLSESPINLQQHFLSISHPRWEFSNLGRRFLRL